MRYWWKKLLKERKIIDRKHKSHGSNTHISPKVQPRNNYYPIYIVITGVYFSINNLTISFSVLGKAIAEYNVDESIKIFIYLASNISLYNCSRIFLPLSINSLAVIPSSSQIRLILSKESIISMCLRGPNRHRCRYLIPSSHWWSTRYHHRSPTVRKHPHPKSKIKEAVFSEYGYYEIE